MNLKVHNESHLDNGSSVIYVPKKPELKIQHIPVNSENIGHVYLDPKCRKHIDAILNGVSTLQKVYVYSPIVRNVALFKGKDVNIIDEQTGNTLVSLLNIGDKKNSILGLLDPGNNIYESDRLPEETFYELAERIGITNVNEKISLLLDRQLEPQELDELKRIGNIEKIQGIIEGYFGSLHGRFVKDLSEEQAVIQEGDGLIKLLT